MRLIFCLFALCLLNACHLVDVPEPPVREPLPIAENAQPSPINLRVIQIKPAKGETAAAISPRGIFCGGPYGAVTGSEFKSYIDKELLKEAFDEEMQSSGYDVTGTDQLLFDDELEDDQARTVYVIGARITDIKLDACRDDTSLNPVGWFFEGLSSRYGGEAYMKVEWSVYDRLNRKTVYKGVSQGYARRKLASGDGLYLLMADAFSAAGHNLGADPNFNDLLVRGIAPQMQYNTKFRSMGDVDQAITIRNKPLATQPLKNLNAARKIAVAIRTGAGHGSGFFIGNQGYIISNAHVVGSANRVGIVTSDHEQKLFAAVIRRDNFRDVALLKLEKRPKDFNISAQPVRMALPEIGEAVFVIGTPLSESRLQDTVTSGIVSAVRPARRNEPSYIQSDAYIAGGNSGGPMLDARGNIIGLSVAGYEAQDGATTALNLFVPIGEALQKLRVEVLN